MVLNVIQLDHCLQLLGHIYYQVGDYAKAQTSYEKSVDINVVELKTKISAKAWRTNKRIHKGKNYWGVRATNYWNFK